MRVNLTYQIVLLDLFTILEEFKGFFQVGNCMDCSFRVYLPQHFYLILSPQILGCLLTDTFKEKYRNARQKFVSSSLKKQYPNVFL